MIDYFPKKTTYVLRAKQQLSLIYLRKEQYDRAMAIFDELAALGDDQPELKAFGLAGKCGVLSLRGQFQESDAVLRRLWPIHARLENRQMRRLLEYAIERNRSKLGQQSAREWDQWLSEQFHEGD